jgi:uncharacterized protein YbjT (DUF2867 family)
VRVAVAGPTGTFGFGLLPLLQADERVERIVGIARRPFDPAAQGWTKLQYRQGDVRDPAGLERAFRGADVVVHLGFMITGTAARRTIRHGSAAVRLRLVGRRVRVHADGPIGMTEDSPLGWTPRYSGLEALRETLRARA